MLWLWLTLNVLTMSGWICTKTLSHSTRVWMSMINWLAVPVSVLINWVCLSQCMQTVQFMYQQDQQWEIAASVACLSFSFCIHHYHYSYWKYVCPPFYYIWYWFYLAACGCAVSTILHNQLIIIIVTNKVLILLYNTTCSGKIVVKAYYSMVANSTKSVSVLKLLPVYPPTTINWLVGRTAAIHRHHGVHMWLMTSQESVAGLYMRAAAVGSSSEPFPPIASSRFWIETQVVSVTGGAIPVVHTPVSLLLKVTRNDLQDRIREITEHVYMLDSPRM